MVLKAVLRYISKFERSHTKTAEIFSAMVKLFVVSYINTGVVIFVVNINLGVDIPYFPVLNGNYPEFTV
jgi:hypothetical protein